MVRQQQHIGAMVVVRVSFALWMGVWTSPVIAQETPNDEAVRLDELQRFVSITTDPILFFDPYLKLNVEYRLAETIGILGALGGGRSQFTSRTGDVRSGTASRFESEAQLRYYLVGDFSHGLPIGVGLYYSRNNETDEISSADRMGVAFILGYKVCFKRGFTLDLYMGALSTYTRFEQRSTRVHRTLLRSNLGWTF